MSRIGNQPITLPAKVEVAISGGEITVKGPLGSLSRRVAEGVTVEKSGDATLLNSKGPGRLIVLRRDIDESDFDDAGRAIYGKDILFIEVGDYGKEVQIPPALPGEPTPS